MTNGSGMPVTGMIPMTMPDVDQELEQDHRGQPDGDHHAERVTRLPADEQDPPDQQPEQAEQQHEPPTKPSSSATTVKMKSVRLHRDVAALVLARPTVRPCPSQPPDPTALSAWTSW